MQISVKENSVFSVFHPDALDLFNMCSDLKKVAHDLCDPSRRLNEADKQITLFQNFAPMLCKRPPARLEDSLRGMGDRPFVIEEKLDGERMQLHKRGSGFFFCSRYCLSVIIISRLLTGTSDRKGKDYTYLYGADGSSGSLVPYIEHAFDERIEEYEFLSITCKFTSHGILFCSLLFRMILDGEMLVWDPVSERNLPFGALKTAALSELSCKLLPFILRSHVYAGKPKSVLNPRPCCACVKLC